MEIQKYCPLLGAFYFVTKQKGRAFIFKNMCATFYVFNANKMELCELLD